ncbi:ketoacyl-synt-domain-containing protein [Agrocybe pediades]|nr:ketoacyl-synt-domain-containing protein [Agrocybe pediades]
MSTLLELFLLISRNPSTAENTVLQCGQEQWTYGDLDCISSGLALELYEKHGSGPTVAVISENHPFILAILLATWKLGGSFAPFDCHAPLDMVKQMLINVEATVAVIPENEKALNEALRTMNMPAMTFSTATTMTMLSQRFLEQSPDLPVSFSPPTPSSLAAYLHTSSASSVANLKCVPLQHFQLTNGSRSVTHFFNDADPSSNLSRPKVLAMSPWSHIMSIVHDICGASFSTGGCLVMGVVPSGYPVDEEESSDFAKALGKTVAEMDVIDRLLDTAERTRPDFFVGVPWVLEGFKDRYERMNGANSPVAKSVRETLQHFKCFGVAGAAMTKEIVGWALDIGIRITHNIGMTELAGPLFNTRVTSINDIEEGWPLDDCQKPDAELVLLDEHGDFADHEGELVITDRYIGRGYIKYDNSAFEELPDGRIRFKTGDIYAKTSNNRLKWKGRKEDYIQMITSETLDPRPLEKTLNACPSIHRCAIAGNNFLRKPSDFVCAFIEPVLGEQSKVSGKQVNEITKAVAAVNRTLPPQLRIAWSRVFILEKSSTIPYTRKGAIFRKKLEDHFGGLLTRPPIPPAEVERGIENTREAKPSVISNIETSRKRWKPVEVREVVVATLARVLGMDIAMMRANSDSSFADFGMDSSMAVNIVNDLNSAFELDLPLNSCHTFINLDQLSEAILNQLGLSRHSVHNDPTNGLSTFGINSQIKEDVVIIGQAFRLPGDISTPDLFWEALTSKRNDIITNVPPDRWDHASFYRPPGSSQPQRTGDILFEKAGFVDVAHFDNSFFEISAAEAFYVSPSIRLTLETAFEALENACIPLSKIKGTKMGVFVASGLDEGYSHVMFQAKGYDTYNRFYGTGMASSTASGRISYLLDLHGPSSVTDTACSSGLVALHQAVQYIQSGEGDSAIVGGTNTNLWPGSFAFLSAQKMASTRSRCATFTNAADGYVPSEASVSFILKSKSAALRDGDFILATIKATDTMHGGRSQGLVAPNVNTQISLQRSLLAKSGLQPSQIDFLETHGTGTSLGDLIEIQGINEVFRESHQEQPLLLSASKSCIGHTEIAAGLVGVLSAIASLEHNAVPGLAHLTSENMNPAIDCAIVHMSIPTEATSLPVKHSDEPYRGLVISNGFAGTIAGVVLEQPPPRPISAVAAPDFAEPRSQSPMLFVLSAKTEEGLEQYLKKYLEFCRSSRPSRFMDICYTTCIGREHYRYRFACSTTNMDDLIRQLEERIQLPTRNSRRAATAPGVVFAFPGQGAQFQGMASQLAAYFPGFRDILDNASESAATLSGLPILSYLLDIPGVSNAMDPTIDDSQIAQVCIYVYQYSISTWLKTLGIQPLAVLGSSLGELAASLLAGAMTYESGLELVIKRASLLLSKEPSGMGIIEESEKAIVQSIGKLGLSGKVVIAVYNAPNSHVVSGDLHAVDALVSQKRSEGCRATKLNVGQGFHSPAIASNLGALQSWCDGNKHTFSRLSIPLYSTVYGSEIPSGTKLRNSYWVEHARDPVRLSDAMTELGLNKEVDILLDMGPQPLLFAALQSAQQDVAMVALTTKQSKDQSAAFMRAMGTLFERGVIIDFEKLFPHNTAQYRKVHLPTYPYQRRRYYPDYIPSRNLVNNTSLPSEQQPLSKNRKVHFAADRDLYDMLTDHQIEGHRVVPGAALVDFFAHQNPSRTIKSITFHSPLALQTPVNQIFGEIRVDRRFYLNDANSAGDRQVCSGVFGVTEEVDTQGALARALDITSPPAHVKNGAEVYKQFRNVQFGPSFRNIQMIRTWPTHADILITVNSSTHPHLDRIRKIDCCLHAMGGIIEREVPQTKDMDGAFLPNSLEHYTIHDESLPDSFICRYYLPFTSSRNYHVMSVAFDVLSLTGEKLMSCKKYSVAWVPAGTAISNTESTSILQPATATYQRAWMQQTWTNRPISGGDITMTTRQRIPTLLVSLKDAESRIGKIFSRYTDQVQYLCLQPPEPKNNSIAYPGWLITEFNEVLQKLGTTEISIVLDLTNIVRETASTYSSFNHHPHQVLCFMKLISSLKLPIVNFIAISQCSVPVQDETFTPHVASVIQGMVRVYRRENGLDDRVWSVDLPNIDFIDDDLLQTVISQEYTLRKTDASGDRVVAYRKAPDGALSRFAPTLRPIELSDSSPTVSLNGVSVIVGLGSIGTALASSLISGGSSIVVFIGRRHPESQEVQAGISRIQEDTSGRVFYLQADVCDYDSIKQTFVAIQAQHGSIKNIIHAAAVIADATIRNVDTETFDRVLDPKVIGSWNLHQVSKELCPALESFTLLSSISVSLGNPGQVAYVAGNSYMEVLASYRKQQNLPGTALQLGPWESKLTEKHTVNHSIMNIMENRRGIPLILQAMRRNEVVQIICSFNDRELQAVPAYGQDPLFKNILSNQTSFKPRRTSSEVTHIVTSTLRDILELSSTEKLELDDSLTAFGIDSISFAQIKGKVMNELQVEIPMMFLSDTFSILEMMDYISNKYLSL